jgi:hypothetical protein
MSLKDFTYIDFERVRSYLAQINGKLSEQISETKQHSAGSEASAKANGITKFLIDAEASGNYMYTRSRSETSSLHHAIFDEFSELIKSKELIGSIDDEKPFTEITCHIKVVDYRLLAEQFRSTAQLMPLMTQFISTTPSAKNNQEKAAEKIQIKQIKDIASAVELLFGEVRVLQLIDNSGKIIAQSYLNDELLPQKSVFFAQNNEILPEEWTVYCLKPLKAKTIIEQISNGEDLASSLQVASNSLKALKQVIMPDVDSPTVVPIAIFRELNKS